MFFQDWSVCQVSPDLTTERTWNWIWLAYGGLVVVVLRAYQPESIVSWPFAPVVATRSGVTVTHVPFERRYWIRMVTCAPLTAVPYSSRIVSVLVAFQRLGLEAV